MSQAFQVAPGPIYSPEKPTRSRPYRQFIKRFRCLVCHQKWGIDPCHSGPHAYGRKADDFTCIPLCRKHHDEFDANPEGFARKAPPRDSRADPALQRTLDSRTKENRTMNTPHEYDIHEKRGFHEADFLPRRCQRCDASSANGYWLTEVITYEGPTELLCDECAAADYKLNVLVAELAKIPSCPAREEIIDAGMSVKQMVEALKSHDLAQCAACASTRATVIADRLHVDAAAVCCEGNGKAAA